MEITYSQFDRALFASAREKRVPISGTFELTSRCNLDCAMCYIRKGPNDQAAIREELSAAQWLEIARQARDEGLLYLLLTGGEVFLRPDFFEILDGLSALGLKLTINSNATMITGDVAKRLAEYPVAQIAVTIYGASPETYGRISGNPSGFDRTVNGIRILMENGIRVRLRTTIVRQNYADLEAMFQLADDIGVGMRLNAGVYGCRDGVDNDPFGVRLTPEEQLQCENYYMVRRLKKAGFEVPEPKPPETPEFEDIMSGEIAENGSHKEPQESIFKCAASHFMFSVSPKGRLCACLLMDEPSVNLLPDVKFKRAWEDLKALSDKLPHCQECRTCKHTKYCKHCPARLLGETGCLTKKAPYLCEKAELIATGKYLTLGSNH